MGPLQPGCHDREHGPSLPDGLSLTPVVAGGPSGKVEWKQSHQRLVSESMGWALPDVCSQCCLVHSHVFGHSSGHDVYQPALAAACLMRRGAKGMS
jgi:hypothetical protein